MNELAPSERILVVAAHPDDEVLGCGGVIARCRDQGLAVRVIFLAEGITARFQPEEFSRPDVVDWIERRNQNAFKALAVLGVPREEIFPGTRFCCRLDQTYLIDLVKEIEGHIEAFRPTRIFSHAPEDPNVDHGLVHRALLAAARPLSPRRILGIYAFEIPSSTEWNPLHPFPANVFFDISPPFIDRKIQALAAYGDEMRPPPHPRSEEVIRALAVVRGAQAGLTHAEGFALMRACVP